MATTAVPLTPPPGGPTAAAAVMRMKAETWKMKAYRFIYEVYQKQALNGGDHQGVMADEDIPYTTKTVTVDVILQATTEDLLAMGN